MSKQLLKQAFIETSIEEVIETKAKETSVQRKYEVVEIKAMDTLETSVVQT